MCFRPASVNKPDFICPDCGSVIEETFGVYPENCPFCDHAFTAEELAQAEGGVVPNAAPAVPGAPKAPGVPAASVVPSAPKPPVAH